MSEHNQDIRITIIKEENPFWGRFLKISLWDGHKYVDSAAISKEDLLFLLENSNE